MGPINTYFENVERNIPSTDVHYNDHYKATFGDRSTDCIKGQALQHFCDGLNRSAAECKFAKRGQLRFSILTGTLMNSVACSSFQRQFNITAGENL